MDERPEAVCMLHDVVNGGTWGTHKSKNYSEHSNYVFYSINARIGLQNPKIIDFFGAITRTLQTKGPLEPSSSESIITHEILRCI